MLTLPHGGCYLPWRRMIAVTGVDARSFVNGLVTADINTLPRGSSVATAFLNVKGRVVYEGIVTVPGRAQLVNELYGRQPASLRCLTIGKWGGAPYGASGSPSSVGTDEVDAVTACSSDVVLIESDAAAVPGLVSTMQLYKTLRTSVEIGVLDSTDYAVHVAPPPETAAEPFVNAAPSSRRGATTSSGSKATTTPAFAFNDPRPPIAARCVRRYVSPPATERGPVIDDGDEATMAAAQRYWELLFSEGIAEGIRLVAPIASRSLPFDANLDWLGGGVSFTKGCYLGQEMTQRGHTTLVPRRRLVPIYFPVAASSPAFKTGEEFQLRRDTIAVPNGYRLETPPMEMLAVVTTTGDATHVDDETSAALPAAALIASSGHFGLVHMKIKPSYLEAGELRLRQRPMRSSRTEGTASSTGSPISAGKEDDDGRLLLEGTAFFPEWWPTEGMQRISLAAAGDE